MAIDTLLTAKRLREAGFTEPQAEALVATMQQAAAGADFASKGDLAELRSELREVELRLEAKIRESELRLEAKIVAIKSDIVGLKSDILNRVFGLILGALIVNIIAMVGAVFAVAKLLGH